MVWPPSGTMAVGVADLRAEPADDAELVDQAHFGERIRVLGERGERCYVQGEDLYLGWIRRDAAFIHASQEARLVSVLMAPLHERPDPRSAVLGHAPAGTLVPEFRHYLPESPGLQRDADQQAMLGRKVEEARAGDLMFFGAESVDHVALATGADDFIHAPMKGGVVQRGRVGGDRILRGIRRCLPDGSTT